MEIKISIPKNDYVQPTEVRADVVQKICDVFLNRRGGAYHDIFHPFHENSYRRRTIGVVMRSGKAIEFSNKGVCDGDTWVRFNGEEMKAAFKALIEAGYHMYRVYEYGSWMGYICDKKPYCQDGVEVHSFNDFID